MSNLPSGSLFPHRGSADARVDTEKPGARATGFCRISRYYKRICDDRPTRGPSLWACERRSKLATGAFKSAPRSPDSLALAKSRDFQLTGWLRAGPRPQPLSNFYIDYRRRLPGLPSVAVWGAHSRSFEPACPLLGRKRDCRSRILKRGSCKPQGLSFEVTNGCPQGPPSKCWPEGQGRLSMWPRSRWSRSPNICVRIAVADGPEGYRTSRISSSASLVSAADRRESYLLHPPGRKAPASSLGPVSQRGFGDISRAISCG